MVMSNFLFQFELLSCLNERYHIAQYLFANYIPAPFTQRTTRRKLRRWLTCVGSQTSQRAPRGSRSPNESDHNHHQRCLIQNPKRSIVGPTSPTTTLLLRRPMEEEQDQKRRRFRRAWTWLPFILPRNYRSFTISFHSLTSLLPFSVSAILLKYKLFVFCFLA